MDKYYILKRFFFLKKDMLENDIETINSAIKLICEIEDKTDKKDMYSVIENTITKIMCHNIKEAIQTVALYLLHKNEYDIDKVILNLYQIKNQTIKEKKLYQKYINLIEKM